MRIRLLDRSLATSVAAAATLAPPLVAPPDIISEYRMSDAEFVAMKREIIFKNFFPYFLQSSTGIGVFISFSARLWSIGRVWVRGYSCAGARAPARHAYITCQK